MKIEQNKHVSIGYTLTVDGKQVEKTGPGNPLDFIFGTGMLLPAFEANLVGKKKSDKFAFKLSATEAYGEFIAEAIVELPKSLFEVDGKIEPGLLEAGNRLPMSDNQGNRMIGVVKTVGDQSVTMDFNHPMAGKELSFEGEVLGVREMTDAERTGSAGCGCGCGEGGRECDCDDQKAEGCDCTPENSCGCK